jgi:TonB family protein
MSTRRLFQSWICFLALLLSATGSVIAQSETSLKSLTVAVLDFGESTSGKVIANELATKLDSPRLAIVDRDLTRTAARGAGFGGSLNMSLSEARDLGAAIGCEFYFIGDAQTLRRSPSTGPPFFEAYASIFLVSARTGKLVSWERPSAEAPTSERAEQLLIQRLSKDDFVRRYVDALERTREQERHERELAIELNTPVIEEANEENGDAGGLRFPRPYRRLKPSYPDSAARADAVGTVDVLVDLDKEGEVNRVDLARWAGFGLDEAALNTVRQLHFFPASRDGVAIPIRVLLRYNFRKPGNK